jgi:NDP-sugar pyrophosphorylase family protein
MKLNLVMPMGGGGTRFGRNGYETPKPLIDLNGKPFFYWATESIAKYVELATLTFAVLQKHVDKFEIDKVIKYYYPKAYINVIPEVLPGAVLTCMEGVKNLNENEPVLFNDCDHSFICNPFYDFCRKEEFETIDGGILTFKSDDARFSYVAYGEDGYVNRTVEKEVISNDAICGAYFFRNKQIFTQATEKYLKNCSYNEFYVSGVYNVLANEGYKIKSFNVDEHISFGTPEEYEKVICSESRCNL